MIPKPDELGKKVWVSVGFIVAIFGMGFSLGTVFQDLRDQEKAMEKIREYIEQEVNGLRADWERDRAEQNRRLIELEKDK